ERAKDYVEGVASHVTQRSRAEVHPATPGKGVVRRVVRPLGGGTEPEIPIDGLGHGHAFAWTGDGLRPDGAVRPDMDFAYVTDCSSLDPLFREARIIGGRGLHAHLRGQF